MPESSRRGLQPRAGGRSECDAGSGNDGDAVAGPHVSPDGRCKAFDDSADGFVRGEGCGFVALKTLSQAQADGDRILAVIRGTAINQDGASSSMTAPNGPSQVKLMRQALAMAGVEARRGLVCRSPRNRDRTGRSDRAAGSGRCLWHERALDNPLHVGSLKTNIGHLEAAAGVAGLIKTILAIKHRQIPPHLHLQPIDIACSMGRI